MLGDLIEQALQAAGITSARVEEWLGKPCGCKERQAKLNAVQSWAARVVRGKRDQAAEYLHRLLRS